MADIPDASDGLPPVHLSLSREEKKVLLWEMGRRVNAPVGLIESAIVKMARGEEEHGNDIGTVSIDEMLDEIRDLYV